MKKLLALLFVPLLLVTAFALGEAYQCDKLGLAFHPPEGALVVEDHPLQEGKLYLGVFLDPPDCTLLYAFGEMENPELAGFDHTDTGGVCMRTLLKTLGLDNADTQYALDIVRVNDARYVQVVDADGRELHFVDVGPDGTLSDAAMVSIREPLTDEQIKSFEAFLDSVIYEEAP